MCDKPYWLTGNYCATCKWLEEDEPPTHKDVRGFCHRYPPTYESDQQRDYYFPRPQVNDFCGEYTPKDKEKK